MYIVFTTGNLNWVQALTYTGNNLKMVQTYKYLGLIMNKNDNFKVLLWRLQWHYMYRS